MKVLKKSLYYLPALVYALLFGFFAFLFGGVYVALGVGLFVAWILRPKYMKAPGDKSGGFIHFRDPTESGMDKLRSLLP
jgi:hypothetical protein